MTNTIDRYNFCIFIVRMRAAKRVPLQLWNIEVQKYM